MTKEKVIRIKPYPIPVSLGKIGQAEGAAAQIGQIVKLTEFGFLFTSTTGYLYRAGHKYNCTFELPAMHVEISGPIKVVKTYQDVGQYAHKSAEKALLVEVHFVSLAPENKVHISDYLRLIKQVVK